MRSASISDTQTNRSGQNTPTPWDVNSGRGRLPSHDYSSRSTREGREPSRPENRDASVQRERVDRLASQASRNQHSRHDSIATGAASSGDYQSTGRRHDYDLQAMESDTNTPRPSVINNPIPAPIVTVRSEFPTLNRSRQQQPLTCLVTIEVPTGKWDPDPETMRHGQPNASVLHEDPQTNLKQQVNRSADLPPPHESHELLDEITELLRVRVENWHGLEFQRYVATEICFDLSVGILD